MGGTNQPTNSSSNNLQRTRGALSSHVVIQNDGESEEALGDLLDSAFFFEDTSACRCPFLPLPVEIRDDVRVQCQVVVVMRTPQRSEA